MAFERPPADFYTAVGGEETFRLLVHRFYLGIADDDLIRPMYPAEDLAGAEERLRMFLIQYWGGPGTYSEQRGHPRLRMRHAGFTITSEGRDRWLSHMRAALDSLELDPDHERLLWNYLEMAAESMINSPDP